MKKRKVTNKPRQSTLSEYDDQHLGANIATNSNNSNPVIPGILGGILGFTLGSGKSGSSPVLDGDGVTTTPDSPFQGGYEPVSDENGSLVSVNSRKSVIVTEDDVYNYLNSIIGTGSAPFFYRLGSAIRTGIVIEFSQKVKHSSPVKKHGILCSYANRATSQADRHHSLAPGVQAIEFNSSIMSVSSAYLDSENARLLAREFDVFKKGGANFRSKNIISNIARYLSIVSSIVVNEQGDTIASMMPTTDKGVVADIAGFFDKSMMPVSIQDIYDFGSFAIMHNPAGGYFCMSFRSSNSTNFSFVEYSKMKSVLLNLNY